MNVENAMDKFNIYNSLVEFGYIMQFLLPKFSGIDFLILCGHGRGQNLHLCFSFMVHSLFLLFLHSTDLDFSSFLNGIILVL